MRQLPATSNSGGSGATENSRSRSNLSNDSAGVRILSNGSLKEPILTRSKSRLRGSRRLQGRSPKKPASPLKTNDVDQRRKREKEKRSGTSSRHNSSSSTSRSSSSSPNSVNNAVEKMYARHYKSYRGLNGVKSRRLDRSSNDVQHSPKTVKANRESGRDRRNNRSVSKNSLTRSRNGTTRNHVPQNGLSLRSLSPRKSTRNPSSRIRQLVLRRKKQLSNRRLRGDISPPKSPNSEGESEEDKEGNDNDDASLRRDKAGKRRSALWVLNCEAESFLFGETAAEKHEVELPPLAPPSPPPKKRRWRATELGHLLEKTPILESKLRKSSSSESGSDMQREASPLRKRLKPDSHRSVRRVKNEKQSEKTPEMCSSKSVKGGNQQEQKQVLSPKPELLSPIPFLYSPDSVDYETKTVQFQQMLSNLNWGYSFEKPPYHEPWYDAYSRSESSIIPYSSFVSPLKDPVLLPYEMDKPLRRSRTKPVKNSRKSPRCHASTLAILSSEKPTRSTRSSVALDASPSPTVNNVAAPESTLHALLTTPTPAKKPSTVVTSTSSPSTSRFSPPKQIPSTSRRRNASSASPRPNQNDTKKELGAAQYLWDSIQFLSDPFLVSLLAGDDPEAISEPAEHPNHKIKSGSTKNHRCTNNNYVNCPVKHIVKHSETSERKASLRSGGEGPATNASVNNVTNSRLVSTPKSSPRNQSHHGTNNHASGHHHNNVGSPPVSPSSVIDRVPPLNGITRRFTSRSPPLSPPPTKNAVQCGAAKLANSKNSKGSTHPMTNGKQSGKSGKDSGPEGDNGLIQHDKTVKKSPVILVSDLFSASSKMKAFNNWDEESLFIGDGLPPLPQWPV